MIDERFIKRAIEIRRTYLKVNKDMNSYEKSAKQILGVLQDTLKRVDSLQEDINSKKVNNAEDASKKLLVILEDVEKEGARLEKMVDPLNSEIEKLKDEETELYRLIREKHIGMTDDQIVKEIHDRLIKENLS